MAGRALRSDLVLAPACDIAHSFCIAVMCRSSNLSQAASDEKCMRCSLRFHTQCSADASQTWPNVAEV